MKKSQITTENNLGLNREGGIGMAIKDVRLSEDEYAFAPLTKWSEQLDIPVASLLHHAATGALQVFFRASQISCGYVDANGLDLAAFSTEIPPALPPEAFLKPLYTDSSVFEIRLDSEHCAALGFGLGGEVRVPFFTEVMVKGSPWMAHFNCMSDLWGRELPPSTRIASFSVVPPAFLDPLVSSRSISAQILSAKWDRTPEEYQRTPVSHLIRPSDVLIRDVEIHKFLCSLTSYEFISDLYQEKQLVDELPGYVSEKLVEMTIVNEVFWKKSGTLNRQEIDTRAARAIEYLEGDFKDMCPGTKPADGLVAFAALAANPTVRRSVEHPNVTPSLLALITASKLYWSPAHIALNRNDTLPRPDSVARFLRFMGMTDSHEAESGAVVIRPNDAINYVPRSRKGEAVPRTIDEFNNARRKQHQAMLVAPQPVRAEESAAS